MEWLSGLSRLLSGFLREREEAKQYAAQVAELLDFYDPVHRSLAPVPYYVWKEDFKQAQTWFSNAISKWKQLEEVAESIKEPSLKPRLHQMFSDVIAVGVDLFNAFEEVSDQQSDELKLRRDRIKDQYMQMWKNLDIIWSALKEYSRMD